MVKYIKENNENIKEIPMECIKGATLLSEEEAENLLTQEERKCKYNGEYQSYWLRSSGYEAGYACDVDFDGYVDVYDVYYADIGVRPALILNLQSSNLKIGDYFEFGGYKFRIITKNLALCEEIIGECAFRQDWEAEDANNYEKSDVKKYVDKWFNKTKEDYENKKLGLKTDDEIFNDDFDF